MSWQYDRLTGDVRDENGKSIARLTVPQFRDPNGSLLAAAPALLAALKDQRVSSGDMPSWQAGYPTKPWADEWFIAETTFGTRVVLKSLPEEWTYDFRTADETYIMADKIKRWMQFPDSKYLFPSEEIRALKDQIVQLRKSRTMDRGA